MGIFVEEQQFNKTENTYLGSSGVYETFADEPGGLFRSLRAEYGRCTSSLYVGSSWHGNQSGEHRVGWVFEKREAYEDTGETFLMETWVTLHKERPFVSTRHSYFYI